MKTSIHFILTNIIKDSLKDLGLENVCNDDLILDFPTDSRFGDLSTNLALKLSKLLKKPPQTIAKELAEAIKLRLDKDPSGTYIKEIRTEGAGFINFYFLEKYFYEQLKEIITKKEASLMINAGKGKPVLVEFVSANPTGPLSVAHARQAAVGGSLANILEFLGFSVKRE